MQQENWSMADVFDSVDSDGKGYVNQIDLQNILYQNKRKSYDGRDIEYLLRMYDTEGVRKIGF